MTAEHKPGALVAKIRIGNRFTIREIKTRFRAQTAFFLDDKALPAGEFYGPFYSQRLAMEKAMELSGTERLSEAAQ